MIDFVINQGGGGFNSRLAHSIAENGSVSICLSGMTLFANHPRL